MWTVDVGAAGWRRSDTAPAAAGAGFGCRASEGVRDSQCPCFGRDPSSRCSASPTQLSTGSTGSTGSTSTDSKSHDDGRRPPREPVLRKACVTPEARASEGVHHPWCSASPTQLSTGSTGSTGSTSTDSRSHDDGRRPPREPVRRKACVASDAARSATGAGFGCWCFGSLARLRTRRGRPPGRPSRCAHGRGLWTQWTLWTQWRWTACGRWTLVRASRESPDTAPAAAGAGFGCRATTGVRDSGSPCFVRHPPVTAALRPPSCPPGPLGPPGPRPPIRSPMTTEGARPARLCYGRCPRLRQPVLRGASIIQVQRFAHPVVHRVHWVHRVHVHRFKVP